MEFNDSVCGAPSLIEPGASSGNRLLVCGLRDPRSRRATRKAPEGGCPSPHTDCPNWGTSGSPAGRLAPPPQPRPTHSGPSTSPLKIGPRTIPPLTYGLSVFGPPSSRRAFRQPSPHARQPQHANKVMAQDSRDCRPSATTSSVIEFLDPTLHRPKETPRPVP